MYKIISFLTIVVCLTACCNRKFTVTDNEELKILWQLDLQRGFALDTISIYIDSINLVKDLVVQTENTTAFTGVSIKYYEGFSLSKFFHVKTLTENKVFDKKIFFDETIEFRLIVKSFGGTTFKGNLQVSLKKGKFIGISNFVGKEPTFYINQKDDNFIYY
jgi:hypothetical protein